MKLNLEVTDTEDGGVKVECFRDGQKVDTQDLLTLMKGNRLGAATSACMYVLGMLTWCVKRSREMERGDSSQQIISLPPGSRLG